MRSDTPKKKPPIIASHEVLFVQYKDYVTDIVIAIAVTLRTTNIQTVFYNMVILTSVPLDFTQYSNQLHAWGVMGFHLKKTRSGSYSFLSF